MLWPFHGAHENTPPLRWQITPARLVKRRQRSFLNYDQAVLPPVERARQLPKWAYVSDNRAAARIAGSIWNCHDETFDACAP
jgi:hypothetical protein